MRAFLYENLSRDALWLLEVSYHGIKLILCMIKHSIVNVHFSSSFDQISWSKRVKLIYFFNKA